MKTMVSVCFGKEREVLIRRPEMMCRSLLNLAAQRFCFPLQLHDAEFLSSILLFAHSTRGLNLGTQISMCRLSNRRAFWLILFLSQLVGYFLVWFEPHSKYPEV
jgi:hypothetical protein